MIAQQTLMQFDHIVTGCRATLEAVPDDRLDWRPHEKSWTLGELATHVAMLPNWTVATLTMSEFDVAPDGDGPPQNPELKSSAELVAALDEGAAAARETIAATSDEVFAGTWTLKVAGEDRFSMPKGGRDAELRPRPPDPPPGATGRLPAAPRRAGAPDVRTHGGLSGYVTGRGGAAVSPAASASSAVRSPCRPGG